MAPLPENNTGVVFFDYIANGREHTTQFRYDGPGAPPTGFAASLFDFFDAAGYFMPEDWIAVAWRYRAEGTNITLPLLDALPTLEGANTPSNSEAPAFVSFIGRSTLGSRARVYLIGAGLTPASETGAASDYRLTAAEATQVLTAIQQLALVDVRAIDSAPIAWKSYVNLGYHAYWQRRVRS